MIRLKTCMNYVNLSSTIVFRVQSYSGVNTIKLKSLLTPKQFSSSKDFVISEEKIDDEQKLCVVRLISVYSI